MAVPILSGGSCTKGFSNVGISHVPLYISRALKIDTVTALKEACFFEKAFISAPFFRRYHPKGFAVQSINMRDVPVNCIFLRPVTYSK